MSARGVAATAFGVVAGLVSLLVLAQLSVRADRAYEAVTAVRYEGRRVTVLFDRLAPQDVLGSGWTAPARGQGAWSTAPVAYLNPPTSAFQGDVLISLTLASPPRRQPVTVRLGDTVIGVWSPSDDRETTISLVAPSRLRTHSYGVMLAVEAGDTPVRVIRATTELR